MPDEEIPLLERVASYYSQLSTVAADLNAVSDELGKSIAEIDAALKKLNLGITTWVTIQSGDGDRFRDNYSFWSRDIGYAKVDSKWGITLRNVDGDYRNPDDERVEKWRFDDAPRSLRLESIDKIPELLEKLSKEAAKTTKDIRAKLCEVQSVASAVKGAANRTAQIPHRASIRNPTPKVDLSHISKPGDVLKAILTKKQTELAESSEVSPAPMSDAPNLESIRHAVGSALVDAGHESAAQLLGAGSWTIDGTSLRIEVAAMGKKMLALTLNAAAEKIIRQELQRLGAPTRFLVVPKETVGQTAAPIPAAVPSTDTSKGVEEW